MRLFSFQIVVYLLIKILEREEMSLEGKCSVPLNSHHWNIWNQFFGFIATIKLATKTTKTHPHLDVFQQSCFNDWRERNVQCVDIAQDLLDLWLFICRFSVQSKLACQITPNVYGSNNAITFVVVKKRQISGRGQH